MIEKKGEKFPPTGRIEKRRAETDKIFAEMQDKERKERLAKTVRLRNLRLMSLKDAGPPHQ